MTPAGYRQRAPLALVVLAATALSGCTANDEADLEPIVINDPDDFSYAQNSTGTGRPHIHDYWGGEERLEVLHMIWHQINTRDSLLLQDANGYSTVSFRPPVDHIIPLGTEYVEVTVSWREDWRIGDESLELWIKAAADDDSVPFAQIQNGETVRFESTNDQNDIPHQRLSAWRFDVAVPDGVERPTGDTSESYAIQFEVTVEAVRGLEIPPYPPHPDLWPEGTTLPFLDETREYVWFDPLLPGHYTTYPQTRCIYCDGSTAITPGDGFIVPFDADHVELVADIQHDTPDGIRFFYHGADTWDFKEAPLADADGDRHTYIIPVDGDGDSPYALQSLWRFAWEVDRDEPPYLSEGSFSLTATIHREADP